MLGCALTFCVWGPEGGEDGPLITNISNRIQWLQELKFKLNPHERGTPAIGRRVSPGSDTKGTPPSSEPHPPGWASKEISTETPVEISVNEITLYRAILNHYGGVRVAPERLARKRDNSHTRSRQSHPRMQRPIPRRPPWRSTFIEHPHCGLRESVHLFSWYSSRITRYKLELLTDLSTRSMVEISFNAHCVECSEATQHGSSMCITGAASEPRGT